MSSKSASELGFSIPLRTIMYGSSSRKLLYFTQLSKRALISPLGDNPEIIIETQLKLMHLSFDFVPRAFSGVATYRFVRDSRPNRSLPLTWSRRENDIRPVQAMQAPRSQLSGSPLCAWDRESRGWERFMASCMSSKQGKSVRTFHHGRRQRYRAARKAPGSSLQLLLRTAASRHDSRYHPS